MTGPFSLISLCVNAGWPGSLSVGNVIKLVCIWQLPNGPRLRESAFEYAQKAHVQIICPCTKYYQGLCSPSKRFVVSDYSASGSLRPLSDYADSQADQSLCCPHLPEDMFSRGEAQIKTVFSISGAFIRYFTASLLWLSSSSDSIRLQPTDKFYLS